MANRNPRMTIIDHGFRFYSIAGYETYAEVYRDSEDPTNPLKGMMLISSIGYQEMTIVFVSKSKIIRSANTPFSILPVNPSPDFVSSLEKRSFDLS